MSNIANDLIDIRRGNNNPDSPVEQDVNEINYDIVDSPNREDEVAAALSEDTLGALVFDDLYDRRRTSSNAFSLLSTHVLRDYPGSVASQSLVRLLSKSSICQNHIIDKFYDGFFEENEIQSLIDKIRQTKIDLENTASAVSIKDFSFYLSLLDRSYKYFSGTNLDFSYALDHLNIKPQSFKSFLLSTNTQQNFINLYKHILGYNNINDHIPEVANNRAAISADDAFKISENTAILSLTQKLNSTVFFGNSLALNHSTTRFKNGTGTDPNNLLTFDKREFSHSNVIVGTDVNYLSGVDTVTNEFDEIVYPGFDNVNSFQLSSDVYSSQILEDEISTNLDTLNGDNIFDRNIDLMSLDAATVGVPDLYKPLMKAILKTNCSITNLAVRTNDQDSQYFGKNELTFMKSANIEANNILFGMSNSSNNSTNLTKFISKTRKAISLARSSLSFSKKDKFLEDNSYLNDIFNASYQEDSNRILNKLGVTNQRQFSSLVARADSNLLRNVFLKDDIDIFETNDLNSSNPGFSYFTNATSSDLNEVIASHTSELEKIESSIDKYYENKLSGKSLYENIVKHATLGVEKSLERLNESRQFDYGNLPVHLLETVSFISRYTGNKNFKNQTLTHQQEEFKSFFNTLLLYSVKNTQVITDIKASVSTYLNANNITPTTILRNSNTLRSDIAALYNNQDFNLLDFITSISSFFYGPDIRNRGPQHDKPVVPENDFRRYAKDSYNVGRARVIPNRLVLPSPRYFLVCGIPFIDIYSNNRTELRRRYNLKFSPNETSFPEDVNEIINLLKSYAEGFHLVYYPFIGFVSLGTDSRNNNGSSFLFNKDRISDINSLYKIRPDNGILSQLLNEKNGIISEYVKFLSSQIKDIDLNLDNLDGIKEKSILSFIENSFSAYCNIVILKLSQTFEYSTSLNAVKLFSEGPLDVHRGIDPIDPERQNNVYLQDVNSINRLSSFQRSRNLINHPTSFAAWSYRSSNVHLKDWFYPKNSSGQYYPSNQVFINYYDKIGSPGHRKGWAFFDDNFVNPDNLNYHPRNFPDQQIFNRRDPRQNHSQGRPALINNILGSLYFRSTDIRNIFLEYFASQDYTDLINRDEVATAGLDRKTIDNVFINFSGGTFASELVSSNAQADVSAGQLNLNNNEYLNDLIAESNHFLYGKNTPGVFNSINTNLNLRENILDLFYMSTGNEGIPEDDPNWPVHIDNTTRVSYFSQYNINYPIIHQGLYIKNIYNGLVKPSYDLLGDKTKVSYFPSITPEQNSDSIFNALNKVYSGALAEDIGIAYLFDATRYAFKHMDTYKQFLEENQNEETQESIQRLTSLLSNQYDDQSQFSISEYLQKVNLKQKKLIDKNLTNLEESLQNTSLVETQYQNSIRRKYADALSFSNSIDIRNDTIVLCVGIKKGTIADSNGDFKIQVKLYDSQYKVTSEYLNFPFNISEPMAHQQIQQRLEDQSRRVKNYLTVISGFSLDENSLFASLNSTTSRLAEVPRTFTERLERLKEHSATLNDAYQEMFDQPNIEDNEGFVYIESNVDFNIKNDVYTNMISNNNKAKKDIYNRILKSDYKRFTDGGIAESIMPKEFIKVIYIPIRLSSFNFRNADVRRRQEYTRYGHNNNHKISVRILPGN